MRSFISLLLFLATICAQPAIGQNFKYDRVGPFKDGLAPVYMGKMMGYIDNKGKEIIPLIYDDDYYTDGFTDGVTIVTKNGLVGAIDKTGKLIVPCEYKMMSSFSEGIAEVQTTTGKIGFVDSKGKVVVAPKYSILNLLGGVKCINGMLPVRNETGKNGYIDKTGKLVVPFMYEEAYNFSDGLGKVKTTYNGKVSYLNNKGEIAIPAKYDDGTIFTDGLAFVNLGARAKSIYSGLEGGKWGVIDKTGKEVIPVQYDRIEETKNGLVIITNGKYPNEKKGLFDKNGKNILPAEYYDIKILNGRIAANKVFVGPYALFDYSGKQVCDYTWNLFDIFPEITDGFLRVQELKNNRLGKVGAIDINGVLKIPFMYDAMNEFSEGLSTVSLNKKYGCIDKTGKVVIPIQYDAMGSFSEGWAPVYQNKKYGFINKAGKLMEFSGTAAAPAGETKPAIAAGKYQYKEPLLDFFIVVNGMVPATNPGESTGGKFGVLSKDEKLIIPQQYDWISLDSGARAFFVQTGVYVVISAKGTRVDTTAKTRIGILDYNGKQLYPSTLSTYIRQPNKYTLVKDAVTRKWGVLDANFKVAVPLSYDLVYRFTESCMPAKKNGKIGIINVKNEILVPFEYDSVYTLGNKGADGYQLKAGNKIVRVDSKGKMVQAGPEPYETNFQNALQRAGNSKERADALMNFLNPVYTQTDSLNFSNIVKQKIEQMASIDFYAIHVMAMNNKNANQAKLIPFISNSFTPKQRGAFKTYSQCIIDNFTRSQNGQAELPCPPAYVPQPGQPWKD